MLTKEKSVQIKLLKIFEAVLWTQVEHLVEISFAQNKYVVDKLIYWMLQ